jgi:hypothetical protein
LGNDGICWYGAMKSLCSVLGVCRGLQGQRR